MKHQIFFSKKGIDNGSIEAKLAEIIKDEIDDNLKEMANDDIYEMTIDIRNIKKSKVELEETDKVFSEILKKKHDDSK